MPQAGEEGVLSEFEEGDAVAEDATRAAAGDDLGASLSGDTCLLQVFAQYMCHTGSPLSHL